MKRIAMMAVLAVTAGCAALGKQSFAKPSVALRDVRLVGLGVAGGELEVVLAVANPNHYRIDANKITYHVFVSDSVPVANGTLDNRATVQADDSTIVKLPLSFTYAGLGAARREIMNSGVLNYKVTGDLVVGSVVGNFTVPFSTTGRYSTMRR